MYRLKPNETTRGPSRFLFFDTETRPVPSHLHDGEVLHYLRLGCAIALTWTKGKITKREVCHFTTKDQFWAFLRIHLRKRKPLWCFAHNLPFDFRVVGGFESSVITDPHRWAFILADPPTLIRGEIDGCPVKFLDSLNFFPSSLRSIGDDFGLRKFAMPSDEHSDKSWMAYCQRDVEIVERAVLSVRELFADNDLGVFGKTAAQCSMNAFRHRFMPVPPIIHEHEEATQLERCCLYGGRVECHRIGEVAGEWYALDVNSLYPAMMIDTPLPFKFLGYYVWPKQWFLRDRADDYFLCAHVLIDSPRQLYPKRRKRDLIFARGQFWTYLCGAELRRAILKNHVVTCAHAALYEPAVLFHDFVDYFYKLRLNYRALGNEAWAAAIKMILLGLSGKWAQQSPKYMERPGLIPPTPWGPFVLRDAIQKRNIPCRAIQGLAQELLDLLPTWHSFPAITAGITAAGRVYMDELKRIAGEGNVAYEDTDSMVVNAQALDQLARAQVCNKAGLGELKLAGYGSDLCIRGAKQWRLGGQWKRAGVPANAKLDENGIWQGWEFVSAEEALAYADLPAVPVRPWHRTDKIAYNKGHVRPDGKVDPFTLVQMFDVPGFA